MGRAKIPMEHINNDKKRSITLHRRKDGIIKKALELTTLCDVNVSMIICTDHQKPQIFPPDPSQFNTSIHLYRQKRISEPGKIRTYDLCDFFTDRKTKIEEELVKAKKKNLEAKYPSWFDFLNTFSERQLREFALGLGNKIDHLKTKVESFNEITSIQNLDYCPFYPTTVLDVQNYLLTPPSNPAAMIPFDYNYLAFNPPYPYVDPNNLIMQSSNPDSAMKLLMTEDNNCYDHDNLSLQPLPPSYCFAQETLQQQEQPPFMHMQPFLNSGFLSQLMEYKTGADGIYFH